MSRCVPQSDRHKTLQVIVAARDPLTREQIREQIIQIGGGVEHLSSYLRVYVKQGKVLVTDNKYRIGKV